MNILIVGRGVIGTQYAWAFEKAGHKVSFYIRKSSRDKYSSSINLKLWDARRNKKDRYIQENWSIKTHFKIESNHNFDLIMVSVNPQQIKNVAKEIAPFVGKATVLFFGNIWHDPITSLSPIPASQIVCGFPGAGGGFEGNTLYGGLYKSVQFGSINHETTENDIRVRKLFESAGFKVIVKKDLSGWLKNHFALNAAMEIEVLKSGNFQAAISNMKGLKGIAQNMREMNKVMKAIGIKPDATSLLFGVLPPFLVGHLMHTFLFNPNSPIYDLVARNQSIAGYAVKDMLIEAKKYGVHTPRLFEVEPLVQALVDN